jgi:hypothetical protein
VRSETPSSLASSQTQKPSLFSCPTPTAASPIGDAYPSGPSTQRMSLTERRARHTPRMSFSSSPISSVRGINHVLAFSPLTSTPGYTRIILAALSMYYMKDYPGYCTLLYSVSCLLDAFDGMAARALKQTSQFGAVLDMVTDRYGVLQIFICCSC